VAPPKSKIAASMKSRHVEKPDSFQPGPGAYDSHKHATIGSNAPKVSIHKKLGDYTFASSSMCNTQREEFPGSARIKSTHFCVNVMCSTANPPFRPIGEN
jgi:hypothetical protein